MTEKQFQKKLEKIKKQGERYKQEKKLRDAYAKYMPEKHKRKVSNIMLAIIVIAIVGYVILNFYLQLRTSVEISPTITTCWFAFWTAEIIALMGIKVSKVKKDNLFNTTEENYVEENYIEEETEDESNDNDIIAG